METLQCCQAIIRYLDCEDCREQETVYLCMV